GDGRPASAKRTLAQPTVPRASSGVRSVDPHREGPNRLEPRPMGGLERLAFVVADNRHRSPNGLCSARAVAPCGFEVSLDIEDVFEPDDVATPVGDGTRAGPCPVNPGEDPDPGVGQQFAAEERAWLRRLAPGGFPSLQFLSAGERQPALRVVAAAGLIAAQPLGSEQDLEAACG